jgi:peroxiredoxin
MTKLLTLCVVALFAVATFAGGQNNTTRSGSRSGTLVSSSCNADEAFAEIPDCTKNVPGAKLSLLDDTDRVMYGLEPQESVAAHLGDSVTVHGTLDGGTIHVTSLELMSIGLAVGQKAPSFSAHDQFGRVQTLDTLKGADGTVLLFFRSVDWWPFCKGQLVQLQSAIPRFEKQGVKFAAISYDSQEILKYFADRHKLDYPTLADPDSKIIQAYGVLNQEATGMQKGFARPGYFFIDTKGVIREKFFEAKYRERLTGNSIISKLFPELGQEVTETVEAPHLQLALEQSDRTGVPGTRITLVAEVRLPPDVHVYAPGTQGYKPTKLVIDDVPEIELKPAVYPQSKILYLPVIKERVPVFEGTFRISQDVKVSSGSPFGGLAKDGKIIAISGKIEYQACDKTTCYLPASIPVKWQLQVFPLDRTRAPVEIRHKWNNDLSLKFPSGWTFLTCKLPKSDHPLTCPVFWRADPLRGDPIYGRDCEESCFTAS